jgi:hypothetical protein
MIRVAGGSRKPIRLGSRGGLNAYGFAGGDPVNYSDPFGLFPWDKAARIALWSLSVTYNTLTFSGPIRNPSADPNVLESPNPTAELSELGERSGLGDLDADAFKTVAEKAAETGGKAVAKGVGRQAGRAAARVAATSASEAAAGATGATGAVGAGGIGDLGAAVAEVGMVFFFIAISPMTTSAPHQ